MIVVEHGTYRTGKSSATWICWISPRYLPPGARPVPGQGAAPVTKIGGLQVFWAKRDGTRAVVF